MSEFSDKLRGVEVVHHQDIEIICNAADELDKMEAMLIEQDKQMQSRSLTGQT